MVFVNSIIQMVIFIEGIVKMVFLMEMVKWFTKMVRNMSVCGKTIINMDKENIFIRIRPILKGSGLKINLMAKANFNILMGPIILGVMKMG